MFIYSINAGYTTFVWKPKSLKLSSVIVGLLLGLSLCFLGPRFLNWLFSPFTEGHLTETTRATSPDGKLDAVLIEEEWGGAVGGFNWYVYIVPKGKSAPRDDKNALFVADELTGEQIVWNKSYLVEIHYDKARIMSFRNICGATENENEDVELRLVPASPDYSLLTPEGPYRSAHRDYPSNQEKPATNSKVGPPLPARPN